MNERESMSFDVVIVGAGVAGLCAAIRLKQLDREHGGDTSVVVLEKGAEVGAHVLSGAIIDPVALDELLPDWRERGAPLTTRVTRERLSYLTGTKKLSVPVALLPRSMRQENCYIGSLGALTRWLAEQAEALGVEIYPGFAGAELLFDEAGAVKGVATPDHGLDRNNQPTDSFARGVELHGRHLLVAEGARGFLSQQLISRFKLDKGCSPAKYALGLKELWEVPGDLHQPGQVEHMIGWPLKRGATGGGFVYHYGENLVSIGLVVHADYQNPALSPFDLLQRFKTHRFLKPLLSSGKRIGYGARTLSVGGFAAMPEPFFPGGMLIGCSAGLFDMARLKGVHNAMLSAMAAAECCSGELAGRYLGDLDLCHETARVERGFLSTLQAARNVKPLLARFGTLAGGGLALLDQWSADWLPKSMRPELSVEGADRDSLRPLSAIEKDQQHFDGLVSFDKPSSLQLAGVDHDENQPVHLIFRDAEKQLLNIAKFGLEPAQYYCPAGVYEVRQDEQKRQYVDISPSNCLHCKMCDIKDPSDNIIWTLPPSGGPNYVDM